jgi:cation transport regulator ChaB
MHTGKPAKRAYMPYKSLAELPESVRREFSLGDQRAYAAAYNCAWEQFRSLAGEPSLRGGIAAKAARRAVSKDHYPPGEEGGLRQGGKVP